jgi:hypothetical protein
MQQIDKENIALNGYFKIDHYDRYGNLIEIIETPNLITNAGKAEVSGLIGTDTTSGRTAFDYIAVGTGTTAATATDTQLGTEVTNIGLTRAAGTGSRVTTSVANDTFQLTYGFSVTGTAAVTEAGVLNAASTGVLLCRQTFSALNVINGDSLTITWKVQIS